MNINGCSNGTHVLMDSFQKIIRTIRKAVVLSLGRGRSPLRYFGAVDQTFDVLLREDQNGRIHGHSDSRLGRYGVATSIYLWWAIMALQA